VTTTPLLMIPGPTPLRDEVRAALAEPVRSHTSTENAQTVRRVQRGIRECIGSAAARVHVLAGSGTLAMEVALVNHAAPGQRVVVVSHGYFGDRFTEIGRALGMHVDVVAAPWGEHVDPAELHRVIYEGDAPAVLAPTLSVLGLPEGVDDAALRSAIAAEGVIVAGCLGPFAGRGIRVAHMGAVGQAEVLRTLDAVRAALTRGSHRSA
jgi:aspartate aminotransferase-like enzyme